MVRGLKARFFQQYCVLAVFVALLCRVYQLATRSVHQLATGAVDENEPSGTPLSAVGKEHLTSLFRLGGSGCLVSDHLNLSSALVQAPLVGSIWPG